MVIRSIDVYAEATVSESILDVYFMRVRTLTTDRAEPALGLALAPRRRLRGVGLRTWCCAIRCGLRASTILGRRGSFSSRSDNRFTVLVSNCATRAELNHVNGAFSAGD